MRTIAFMIIFLLAPLMVLAEETSPLDQLKIDTWQMTPEVVEFLAEDYGKDHNWDDFDKSLMSGITTIRWGFCPTYLDDKYGKGACRSGGGWDFTDELKEYVLSPTFAKVLLAFDNGQVVKRVIDSMGVGRAELLLKQTSPVYNTPFDAANGLAYVSWGENLCHIRLAYPDLDPRKNEMTYEECREDKFTQYLNETYCADDGSDRCLLNTGWLYGFLVRRYFDGGAEAALNWQELMQRAAVQAGIALEVVEPIE